MFRHLTIALTAAAVAFAGTDAHAQDVELPEGFDEEFPLFPKALGPLSRDITTSSPVAKAYFDQGLQMMYAFTPLDAAKSFRAAWAADPECAMCYWGEAWSWGPYLNGGMGEDDAPRAYAAIRKAQELADDGTDVERALIEAMAVRYAETHDADERRRLDSVYAGAMAEAYDRFPDDMEVGTLYGEALMLLEPRRGNWDIDNPDVMKIHQVLEEVLDRDVTHPGACHLYIHATESTVRPEKAEICTDYLGNAIPGASHINHMPSHTYNRVGRWGEAVRANIQAWHSDMKAEVGEGFAIYPSHNLHMLLFAASMDGQGAIAAQAGKDYGKIVPDGQFYHVLALWRFGRFDEIIELQDAPDALTFRGFWDFTRGYSYLRMDDMDRARWYLERVQRAAESGTDSDAFRGHHPRDLLGVVGGILEAEIQRYEGSLDDAIATLEEAVRIEDGLRYDEPEPLNFSARHWLGDALMDAGRYEDAVSVFEAALRDHPHNGWSLFGLEHALRELGRDGDADRVHEDFLQAWARSDTWITRPIF